MVHDWKNYIALTTSRMNHLVEKFTALNRDGSHIQFVRTGDWGSGSPLNGRVRTSAEASEQLVAALERRFSAASFDLFCVNFLHTPRAPAKTEIIGVEFDNPADPSVDGKEQMSALFVRIGVRLDSHRAARRSRER